MLMDNSLWEQSGPGNKPSRLRKVLLRIRWWAPSSDDLGLKTDSYLIVHIGISFKFRFVNSDHISLTRMKLHFFGSDKICLEEHFWLLRRLRAPHFVAEAHRTVVSLRLLVVTAAVGLWIRHANTSVSFLAEGMFIMILHANPRIGGLSRRQR